MNLKHETTDIEPEAISNSIAEADHRIANHLAMLASYVRLKGAAMAQRDEPLDAQDVQSLTRIIVAQIDAISDLHRMRRPRPIDFCGSVVLTQLRFSF